MFSYLLNAAVFGKQCYADYDIELFAEGLGLNNGCSFQLMEVHKGFAYLM